MTWSPFFTRGHAGPDVDDDARAFVPEDRRKEPFRIGARARELVGVADAGRLDLDQHLAGLRAVELHGLDDERRSCAMGNGGTDVHDELPVFCEWTESAK